MPHKLVFSFSIFYFLYSYSSFYLLISNKFNIGGYNYLFSNITNNIIIMFIIVITDRTNHDISLILILSHGCYNGTISFL